MKRALRIFAICIWILYIIIGIVSCFSGSVAAGIIIALPCILAIALILPTKTPNPSSKHKEQSAPHTPNPQNSEDRKSTGGGQLGRVGYAPLGNADKLTAPNYIVLDVETTGLSEKDDQIIEVAALKVVDGQVVDRYESMVNPHRSIPARITHLTGISDKDVRTAPDIHVVCEELAQFQVGDFPIVAHNAGFDLKFISAAFTRAGIDASFKYIDTVLLSKQAFPDLKDHKLSTLISALNLLDHEQEHRAMSDVEATHRLYIACKDVLLSSLSSTARQEDKYVKDETESADWERGFQLNQLGMSYEANGDLKNAIKYYEAAVNERFDGSHPYQRLAILYRKQKRFTDEIKICDAAIGILSGKPGSEKKIADFQHRKAIAQQKLNSVPV